MLPNRRLHRCGFGAHIYRPYNRGPVLNEPLETTSNAIKLEPFISNTPKIGKRHPDTANFNDIEELHEFTDSLMECRIINIRLHYGRFTPETVVNGIQVTYQNIDNGKIFETTERYGGHQHVGYKDFALDNGELIEFAQAKPGGTVIDQLVLKTNKGKIIEEGGGNDENYVYDLKEGFIVGMFGGWGGHLHHIGFFVAPKNEVRYSKRKAYLLMRASLLKNKEIKDEVHKKLKSEDIELSVAERAFLILATWMDRQTFIYTLKFI